MLDGAAPIDLLTISELITCVHAGVATRSLHHTMGDSGQRNAARKSRRIRTRMPQTTVCPLPYLITFCYARSHILHNDKNNGIRDPAFAIDFQRWAAALVANQQMCERQRMSMRYCLRGAGRAIIPASAITE